MDIDVVHQYWSHENGPINPSADFSRDNFEDYVSLAPTRRAESSDGSGSGSEQGLDDELEHVQEPEPEQIEEHGQKHEPEQEEAHEQEHELEQAEEHQHEPEQVQEHQPEPEQVLKHESSHINSNVETGKGDFVVGPITVKAKAPLVDWQSKKIALKSSLGYILDSSRFSDVTFLVGEKREEVKAHKLILMTRSAVFEAMFERWEQGETASIVVLEDTEPEPFKLFLTYMYTGSCEVPTVVTSDSCELMESTFCLAHKYNLKDLMTRCSAFLVTAINANTAAKYYNFGVIYEVKKIKERAMNFVKRQEIVYTGKDMLDWSLETLTGVLRDKAVTVSQIVMFQGVVRWAQNACKKQFMAVTPANCRSIAKKAILSVRYEDMSFEEFTDEVVTKHKGLLTSQEVVNAYVKINAASSCPIHKTKIRKSPKARPCFSSSTFEDTDESGDEVPVEQEQEEEEEDEPSEEE